MTAHPLFNATFNADGGISEDTAKRIREYSGEPRQWLEFCAECWDEDHGQIRRFETEEVKDGREPLTKDF